MPSGSHGGGGGSHGGGFGGGHFGGAFGGGGSRMPSQNNFGHSYYRGPKRPGRARIHYHFFFWGGHRYAVDGDDFAAPRTFLVIGLFLLFFIAIMGFSIAGTNNTLKMIKADYDYYQDMITYAEEHPECIVTGKIIGKFYNESYGKWYLKYSFGGENNDLVDNGETFCMYSNDDIKHFRVNDPIELAVESVPITIYTDSVNMDYKDFPLEKDGHFAGVKSSLRFEIIFEIVLVAGFAFCVVMFIKKLKKYAQKLVVDENGKAVPEYKYICTYCGSKLRESDTTCPKCGSSTIKTVKKEN